MKPPPPPFFVVVGQQQLIFLPPVVQININHMILPIPLKIITKTNEIKNHPKKINKKEIKQDLMSNQGCFPQA